MSFYLALFYTLRGRYIYALSKVINEFFSRVFGFGFYARATGRARYYILARLSKGYFSPIGILMFLVLFVVGLHEVLR